MKRSDSREAAAHVGFPRLSHQDQLDELGQHQDQLHLPKGQPAVAEGEWLPSCCGPIAALSRSPAAATADSPPAVMSSTSGSSASSVCSDGRKRKDSSRDPAAASKRYRNQDTTSLSTGCTAAGSSLTQIEEAGGFQWSTDPASSVSCVEDATDRSHRIAITAFRSPPGKCKSARGKRASCKRIEEASCAVAAGVRLSRAGTCRTQEDSDSECDEDVTSSDPDRGLRMGHGREFVSQSVESKKRKLDECDFVEAEVLESSLRETRSSLEEEDADYCAQTVSNSDVKVATSSQDSESTSPPLFVLSSGRMSKREETRLGKRPLTVDDEFDRYFAQLIL